MSITRRLLLKTTGASLLAPILEAPRRTLAASPVKEDSWRHGISLFGALKYPKQFTHFDYVNPHAPKTGMVRQGAFGTYDNFNTVVSGLKGNLAAGIDLIYEQLLAPSLDEVSAEYGLVAEAVSYPSDFTTVSFRVRSRARWHDGNPITPDDVIFSFHSPGDRRARHHVHGRWSRQSRAAADPRSTDDFAKTLVGSYR
jgi:microcin C transport system substrate-binding protein